MSDMKGKSSFFSKFGKVHLLAYSLSCWNLFSYLSHYLIYSELNIQARGAIGALVELLLVTLRFGNEVWHKKLTRGDVIHHTVLYIGTFLCFFDERCQPYTYLLTHMNILHVPMLLWYAGGRRNNWAENALCPQHKYRFQSLIRDLFPAVFISSSLYRLSSIILAASRAYATHRSSGVSGSNGFAEWSLGFECTILCILGVPLIYLDNNWYNHFVAEIQELRD